MLFKFIIRDITGKVNKQEVNCADWENIGNYKRINLYLLSDYQTSGEYVFLMSYTTEGKTFLQFARRCNLWSVREWITREFFNKHYKPAKFLAYPEAGKVFRQMINATKKTRNCKGIKENCK